MSSSVTIVGLPPSRLADRCAALHQIATCQRNSAIGGLDLFAFADQPTAIDDDCDGGRDFIGALLQIHRVW